MPMGLTGRVVLARVADDLAEVSARFGAALRQAGLPVGPGRCERFAAAVTVARPATLRALYLCALATLVSSKDQAELLEAVFVQVFGALDGQASAADRPGSQQAPGPAQSSRAAEDLLAQAAMAARNHAAGVLAATEEHADQAAEQEVEHPYLGSTVERLAAQDFAELSEAELASLASLMRGITLAVPLRRSRRERRRPGGPRTDMRATLRQARRTGGHAFALIGRAPARRPRRLVVLCDISGSMEPYARAMIQLLYCAAGGARAEVFSFATRLTRLTPALSRSLPGPALERAGQAAPDWLRRHQDRGSAARVQRLLRPPGHGPRRGGADRVRRLGHRRPGPGAPGDGAAVAGRLPHRLGEPAHQERRLPAAGRGDGGRLAALRRGGQRAHGPGPGPAHRGPGRSAAPPRRRPPGLGPGLGLVPPGPGFGLVPPGPGLVVATDSPRRPD